jgi:hypothetical protein
MNHNDLLMKMLTRFQHEGVEYVLVGGQAVRLNGFLRATEDVDVVVKATRLNGEKIIRALSFLKSSEELQPDWFETNPDGEVENIRMADDLLLDLLFAANGLNYEALLPYVASLVVGETLIQVLNIDGLLKTKTDYRDKDILDKKMLLKLKAKL